MKRLLFTADVIPVESTYDAFASGDIMRLVDRSVAEVLDEADYRFYNFEGALTDSPDTPIYKDGPNIAAPTATLAGVLALRPTAVGLCNNHSGDYGEDVLFETAGLFRKNGVEVYGIGKTREEAARPLIIEAEGKQIGIYALAENEFTTVTDRRAGANPFDPVYTYGDIAELKAKCDYVTVLYHGGQEEYRYPSPEMKKRLHKMADSGADLILCQHTHCISCRENYNGCEILYGQGNFLFDEEWGLEEWDSGLMTVVTVDGDGISHEYIPYHRPEGRGRIALPPEDVRDRIMSGFEARSAECTDDARMAERYRRFVINKDHVGLIKNLGLAHARALNGDMTALTWIINYTQCEPNRERLATALDIFYKDMLSLKR